MMQMNCKERMWAVLNREPVDRVPIHAVAVDGVTYDEVLGKPPRSAFEIIDELVEQYPMIDIFGRIYKLVNDHGHIFPYYVDGMIKNQKDWEYFPSLFPASFPFRTYS